MCVTGNADKTLPQLFLLKVKFHSNFNIPVCLAIKRESSANLKLNLAQSSKNDSFQNLHCCDCSTPLPLTWGWIQLYQKVPEIAERSGSGQDSVPKWCPT